MNLYNYISVLKKLHSRNRIQHCYLWWFRSISILYLTHRSLDNQCCTRSNLWHSKAACTHSKLTSAAGRTPPKAGTVDRSASAKVSANEPEGRSFFTSRSSHHTIIVFNGFILLFISISYLWTSWMFPCCEEYRVDCWRRDAQQQSTHLRRAIPESVRGNQEPIQIHAHNLGRRQRNSARGHRCPAASTWKYCFCQLQNLALGGKPKRWKKQL